MATVDELMARLGMDPGDFVSGARRAGDAVGDLERETAQADEEMSKFGIGFGAAAAAAGAAAGAGLGMAMGNALELDAVQAKLTAQLGLTASESERIGGVAATLYANAYGANIGEVGDAVTSVMQNISGMSTATDAELQSVTGQMMSLAQVMEVDVGGAAQAVGQMMRTGLAGSAQEAMDLLTAATQQGGNRFGDLAETIAGSSATLAQFGLDGATSIGIVTQSLAAGAPSTDFFIGALEELAGNASDSADIFDSLGLSGAQMAQDLNAGGDRASTALTTLMQALRDTQDPAARSAAIVELFGEEATAMQEALLAVDPSTAVAGLGDVAGASERADAALGDLATNTVTKLTRGMEVWAGSMIEVGGPLGGVVALAGAFGPQAVSMAGSLAMVAMAGGPVIKSLGNVAKTAVTTGARWAVSMLRMGANAMLAVGRVLLSLGMWVAGVIAQGAVALASMAVTAAGYVASWVLMGVQAMARAAMMAAAWLIAMGPVGWVIAAVVGLVALIIANWDTVVAWTTSAWTAVTGFISDAWNAITGFVSGGVDAVIGWVTGAWDTVTSTTSGAWDAVLGFITGAWNAITSFVSGAITGVVSFISDAWSNATRLASDAWNNIVNAVQGGARNVLNLVGGLPGQILGALGNLGSLLLSAGGDLVRGLWNGIAGMGNWLWNQIMGWIRRVVPGPILQFLGISSPSKWADKIVGRMIPAGIGQGIIGNAAAATDAARQVAMDTAAALTDGAASAGAAQIGAGFSAAVGGMRPGGSDTARPIGGMRDTAGGGPMVTLNVYNPVGVPTTVSVNRDMQLLSALGTFRRGATV